jgi:hypothetical protein
MLKHAVTIRDCQCKIVIAPEGSVGLGQAPPAANPVIVRGVLHSALGLSTTRPDP